MNLGVSMNYYIFVFWSRSDALSFANSLRKLNIPNSMVQTPREAGRTCGLSVKIMAEYLDNARRILNGMKYSSFGGVFEEIVQNNTNIRRRI